MMRIICRIIGGALCFFGVIGMLTPIPFGLILFVIGLMFLIPSTPSAARGVRWARTKVGIFDRAMTAITNRAPMPYRRVLRQTEINSYDW
ncbi:hypothetical protein [Kordiimonas laminariae]|uniref:hypothetical protein n=1 Tax=Kordiimonas laminariae TaxID=2917717 RepID=UPI001FF666F8|nr:hypothetical protein [Kordiimonas laminariae]MCK0068847.1 hypothetical protein [Kordiimonas laminariae]